VICVQVKLRAEDLACLQPHLSMKPLAKQLENAMVWGAEICAASLDVSKECANDTFHAFVLTDPKAGEHFAMFGT
jgi:hypothetical protein